MRLDLSLERELSTVHGDEVGLQQVANKLAENAVAAMAGGNLSEISSQNGMSTFYQGRPVVIIRVEDSDIGIARELREKIFNSIFATKPAGTELGLSISHQIIQRHGGIISCDSEPGKGTAFTVELPVLVNGER